MVSYPLLVGVVGAVSQATLGAIRKPSVHVLPNRHGFGIEDQAVSPVCQSLIQSVLKFFVVFVVDRSAFGAGVGFHGVPCNIKVSSFYFADAPSSTPVLLAH